DRRGEVRMRRLSYLTAALLAFGLGVAPSPARADAIDELTKQVVKLDGESQNLGQGVQKPSQTAKKDDLLARRLIDAQVDFGTGNYELAALALYDYVHQGKKGRDYDTALYYLAESLFQKG